MTDEEVRRPVSLRGEQRPQLFDDLFRVARGRHRAAGAIAWTRVSEYPGMKRDLAGDLVPAGPVVAQPRLEDDGRGIARAGRRDLDLVAVDRLAPRRNRAAAGRQEGGDWDEQREMGSTSRDKARHRIEERI